MQYGCFRPCEFGRQNSFRRKRQRITHNTHGFINLADFFIRRILDSKDASRAEKLCNQSIQIFRTGTDNDLPWMNLDSSASSKIGTNLGTQFFTAMIGRLHQNLLLIIKQNLAHRPGKHTERKFSCLMCLRMSHRQLLMTDLGDYLKIRFPVNHKITAPLSCFNISFVT